MFEDSVFESRGLAVSAERRWTAAASLAVQAMVATLVVVLPLMHPEALSYRSSAPKAMVLAPVVPPKPPEIMHEVRVATTSEAMTAPAARVETVQGHLSRQPATTATEAAPAMGPASGMGSTGLPGVLLTSATTAAVRVSPGAGAGGGGGGGRMRVSAGVSRGRLLRQIQPVYPRIAVAARVEGAVVVEAVISRAGTIESAHVVSGPGMLAGAALEAVRAAKYQPFLLNGQPTEVETTITVNFRLGG